MILIDWTQCTMNCGWGSQWLGVRWTPSCAAWWHPSWLHGIREVRPGLSSSEACRASYDRIAVWPPARQREGCPLTEIPSKYWWKRGLGGLTLKNRGVNLQTSAFNLQIWGLTGFNSGLIILKWAWICGQFASLAAGFSVVKQQVSFWGPSSIPSGNLT